MEVTVRQGERADGGPRIVVDSGVVKNPAQESSKLVATLNEYGRRLRELEKPSGAQLTQAIRKVLDIGEHIDETVADSINRQSYDRTAIDGKCAALEQKCSEWKWDVLSPDRGGTNTANAYDNLFTVGPWRAVWALSDGTMGTAQSSRKVKQDFMMPDITLEQMRSVDWTLYRFIDDVNQNNDDASIHVGMIAEELDDNGLGQFVEYNDDYEPVGVNYPMLGVWAIHEAHLAHERIDRLETCLKGLNNGVEE